MSEIDPTLSHSNERPDLPLLAEGQEITGENSTSWYVRKGNRSWLVPKPSSINLNLCDSNAVLTAEEIESRERDLAALAAQRNHRPPSFYTDRVNG